MTGQTGIQRLLRSIASKVRDDQEQLNKPSLIHKLTLNILSILSPSKSEAAHGMALVKDMKLNAAPNHNTTPSYANAPVLGLGETTVSVYQDSEAA